MKTKRFLHFSRFHRVYATRAAEARKNDHRKSSYMKIIQKFLLPALALGVSAWTLSAQDAGNPPGPRRGPQDGPGGEGQRPQRRQGGPGMNGQRPPQPPIIAALDLNHDGIIDADEISK